MAKDPNLVDRNSTPQTGSAGKPSTGPARRRGSSRARSSRRSSPLLRGMNSFLSLAMFVMVGAAALGIWYAGAVDGPGPLLDSKAFVVKREESTSSVAQRLASEGIITNSRVFMLHYQVRWLASRFGAKPLLIKAGDYEIQPQASLREVFEVLGEGRTVLSRLTVPEGLTSHQIVERIKANTNLIGDIAEVPPEGALMPDTYKFTRGMTRQALVDLMIGKSREFLETAWAGRQAGLPLRTPEEALVLASIVEKETGRNDERGKVAAVFVNRLRKSMRLQSDPTILYGLFGGQVAWGRPIYKAEIRQKTPYNTYEIDGLPPGPICNPGRSAVLAVLNPASSNDLYFVADGRGGHVFSATLKDHNAAVANWRKHEAEARARAQARAAATAAASAAQPAGTGASTTAQALPVPSSSAGPGVRAGDGGDEEAPPTQPAGAGEGAGGAAATAAGAPATGGVAIRGVTTIKTPTTPAASVQPTDGGQPADPGGVVLPSRKPKRS